MNNPQCSTGSEAPAFGEDPGGRESGQGGDCVDFDSARPDSPADGTGGNAESLLFRFRAPKSSVRRSLFRR